jgi:hypothetical protein
MGIFETLIVGLTLLSLPGIVLAFILFMVYLKRKEDAAVEQFGRVSDKE